DDDGRQASRFLRLSRRELFPAAGALAALMGLQRPDEAAALPPELARAAASIEPYFTEQAAFGDVSRGSPIPHTLTGAKRAEVGLTRETWRLEVIADPEAPSVLGRELTRQNGAALTFTDLMRLAEKRAVRFPKVMTCLNIGCP